MLIFELVRYKLISIRKRSHVRENSIHMFTVYTMEVSLIITMMYLSMLYVEGTVHGMK